ncbi:MAG TPA: NUDIX domain-containing protein, partial [Steroidobacteraceae bacterium]|nr:NUDIX domain-containing protein [Steroidobacteraceae bacterium]
FEAIRAIAAEMISAGAGAPAERARALEALFVAQAGYATPKVDVRAAVFRDDRILLVRERSDGHWTLPGGWADVGDSPSAAVEREALEESGYQVRAVKLAAVYDRNRHGHTAHVFHIWKLFFLCEIVGHSPGEPSRVRAEPAPEGPHTGEHTPASWSETDAADFFREDALPPLSLGRVTAQQIAHMFEHHRDPRRATGFD